jgi:hypothetical protein
MAFENPLHRVPRRHESRLGSRRRGYGSRLMRSIERKVCDKPRLLNLLSKPEALGFLRKLSFGNEHPVCGVESCWQWMSKPCGSCRG